MAYSWFSHFLDLSSMFEIVQAVLVVPVAVHLFGSGTCHLFSLFLNEKELAEKGKRPVVDFFAWIRDVTGDLAMFCIGFLFLTILFDRVIF